ncbi:MAG: hypothetical protein ACP5HM_07395, partial [Anaerolineae bacterium]
MVKNGTNKCGNPQYHCKDCGVYRVENACKRSLSSRIPWSQSGQGMCWSLMNSGLTIPIKSYHPKSDKVVSLA